MEVIFLPFAYKELEDAIVYYNDQLVGLGNQFYDEVIVSIKFIQTFSQAWHRVEKHTRRFNLKTISLSDLICC